MSQYNLLFSLLNISLKEVPANENPLSIPFGLALAQ